MAGDSIELEQRMAALEIVTARFIHALSALVGNKDDLFAGLEKTVTPDQQGLAPALKALVDKVRVKG